MPNIFGADIAGKLNQALGSLVFPQTLVKTSSERDSVDPTKRVKTGLPFPCKGFVDTYKDEWIDGGLVKVTDRKIVILGSSLPSGIVPEPGDTILAEGAVYTIVSEGVTRDPAGATYECRSS